MANARVIIQGFRHKDVMNEKLEDRSPNSVETRKIPCHDYVGAQAVEGFQCRCQVSVYAS